MTYVAYHIDYLENNNIFGAIVSWSECANEYTEGQSLRKVKIIC